MTAMMRMGKSALSAGGLIAAQRRTLRAQQAMAARIVIILRSRQHRKAKVTLCDSLAGAVGIRSKNICLFKATPTAIRDALA